MDPYRQAEYAFAVETCHTVEELEAFSIKYNLEFDTFLREHIFELKWEEVAKQLFEEPQPNYYAHSIELDILAQTIDENQPPVLPWLQSEGNLWFSKNPASSYQPAQYIPDSLAIMNESSTTSCACNFE